MLMLYNLYFILKVGGKIMKNKHVFYYFGSVLPLADITSLMVQFRQKDPYCFILDQDLDYRKVGLIDKTYRIVIGREIDIPTDNYFNLSDENPYVEVIDKKILKEIKLSNKEEQKINKALLKVGSYQMPKYWATLNYDEDVEEIEDEPF